ncbi:MAG: type II toxin-antitoxin system death-on-curing family toxin [Sulfobacillus thermosulfidooxidans]|uniref:Type II toxin-antitoxin system death-on-curing family toxin n=1 Tax=Sulfobacillus thermosulfidooxidans TaxID=28034 RepID=A0A2T2X5N5_SULTH|nr:MAG: type II toxin-antitoxin system death-on-curing family toxin [Sulfobacillus thermosulfidooxidans]
MRWVSSAEAILFQERMVCNLGGLFGLLAHGKLESALVQPLAVVFDYEPFPTPALKVATLIDSLIKTHPFRDDNKRTAMRLGVALLEFNFPQKHTVSNDDIEAVAVGIAEDTVTLEDVGHWLEEFMNVNGSRSTNTRGRSLPDAV